MQLLAMTSVRRPRVNSWIGKGRAGEEVIAVELRMMLSA